MKLQKLLSVLTLAVFSSLLLTTSCRKEDPLSNLTGLLSFGFTNDVIKDYPFTVDNATLVIENKDSLPYQFNVSNLTATFNAIEKTKVQVNGVEQVSGTTTNNFTNNVTYKVTAEDGITVREYTVKVNVAKINPEEVKWNQKTPNAFDAMLETQEYFFLKEKHWVIAGKKFKWFATTPETKLYSSEDGTTWTEETPMGDFPNGFYHNIVVKDNKAYVVGFLSAVETFGSPAPGLENHLYTTDDGINWVKTENALDNSRILSPSINYNNAIYAIGGSKTSFGGALNGSKQTGAPFFPAPGIKETTLISTDGTTFNASETYTEEMPRRTHAASYVYNDKMYIAGGLNLEGYPLSDVWSSTDGVTWTKVSDGAFSARLKASTVVYDNNIWMFGGQLADGNCTAEVLVSKDGGVTWESVSEEQKLPSNYTARCAADITVDTNGTIWIIGGETTSVEGEEITTTVLTDVWTGKLNKLN